MLRTKDPDAYWIELLSPEALAKFINGSAN